MTCPHTEREQEGLDSCASAWHYTIGDRRRIEGTLVGPYLDTEDEARREIARQHGVSVEAVRVRRAGENAENL